MEQVLSKVQTDPFFGPQLRGMKFYPDVLATTETEERGEGTPLHFYRTHRCLAWVPYSWVTFKFEVDSAGAFMNVREVTYKAIREGDSYPCWITTHDYEIDAAGRIKKRENTPRSPSLPDLE